MLKLLLNAICAILVTLLDQALRKVCAAIDYLTKEDHEP